MINSQLTPRGGRPERPERPAPACSPAPRTFRAEGALLSGVFCPFLPHSHPEMGFWGPAGNTQGALGEAQVLRLLFCSGLKPALSSAAAPATRPHTGTAAAEIWRHRGTKSLNPRRRSGLAAPSPHRHTTNTERTRKYGAGGFAWGIRGITPVFRNPSGPCSTPGLGGAAGAAWRAADLRALRESRGEALPGRGAVQGCLQAAPP